VPPDGGGDRAPKRLMIRGREIKTVEEAAEASALLELAHDQNGCRFLQDQLDLRNKAHIDTIFEAVKSDVVRLSTDPFGNYLIQKLLQYGVAPQRVQLVLGALNDLVPVALNVHGTRVVQKMVECADTPEQTSAIAMAISPRTMDLIRDMNGNHVIQRCLASLPAQDSSFIFERVTQECFSVATHRHGCCVLQRCLDHATSANREALIAEIITHVPKLVVDPFGNYVVQYILELRQPPLTHAVVTALQGCFTELSLQKFSSNVIEKCLKSGDSEVVTMVARELISTRALATLLHDPFANYVMQTLLTVISDEEIETLVDRMGPHLPSLRSTLYGKRIQAKLHRRCPKLR